MVSQGRGWVGMSPRSLIPDSPPLRMGWAAGEGGKDLRGQPGPWELCVGLLLSGERAW